MEHTQELSCPSSSHVLHTGVVESFVNGVAHVQIYHGGNCGTCSAKGGCATASLGEKGHWVDIPYDGSLSVGQNVNVALKARTDFLAILLAFGVPIVLMVSVMLTLIKLGWAQAPAGLASIGSVVVWIGILMLFRKQLQKKFELIIVDGQ